MKVKVEITITINGDVDDIGKMFLRKYVRDELLAARGLRPLEHPIRLIENVSVSGVTVVRSKHDNKVAGGKARAKALSPERRKEIGRLAAAARWGDKS